MNTALKKEQYNEVLEVKKGNSNLDTVSAKFEFLFKQLEALVLEDNLLSSKVSNVEKVNQLLVKLNLLGGK